MPLRDHALSPAFTRVGWRSFHSTWPAVIVEYLLDVLPPGYAASPLATVETIGGAGGAASIEVGLGAIDSRERPAGRDPDHPGWAPGAPTRAVHLAEPAANFDEFSVHMVDHGDLVAAVELVSPRNKDRPMALRAFVTRCKALLQAGVSVAIVDIVAGRPHDLQRELMRSLGDEGAGPTPGLYSAATRFASSSRLETWEYSLALGDDLTTIPLWLNRDLAVPLDLERTYQKTCRILRI